MLSARAEKIIETSGHVIEVYFICVRSFSGVLKWVMPLALHPLTALIENHTMCSTNS